MYGRRASLEDVCLVAQSSMTLSHVQPRDQVLGLALQVGSLPSELPGR